MVTTKSRVRWCLALIIANIVFIWGNSLMPAEISAAFSNFVQKVLQMFISGQNTVEGTGTGLLRKLAHLLEFTCLGVLLCWYLLMGRKNPVLALIPGLCAACVDEIIQCFVPGRGPRVTDVAIDLAGVSLGLGAMLLIQFLRTKFRRNKS